MEESRKRDAEADKLKSTYGEKPLVELDAPKVCQGVFFHCPLIGPEVLPKEEMKAKIRQFLYSQLEEEKGLTACLIIHTFAKDGKICIDTLCKYMDNILKSPDDEKFRKIRKSNKAYQERVAKFEGHDLFLEAVGFQSQALDGEEYWILDGELNPERLEMIENLREGLVNSEPIRAELDRSVRILNPNQAGRSFSLPDDFYTLTADEIRKEQQLRTEAVEREGMLRTKAMREREAQMERRRYRYTLIRVRFPDGIVLQATFSVYEKYRCVHDLITESLEFPLPFLLYEAAGGKRLEIEDYETTLSELDLAPSALLTFGWHPEVAAEVKMQVGQNPVYLKADLMSLLSDY